MSDDFDRAQRLARVRQAEDNGDIADSMDVRRALLDRVYTGEIYPQEAQAELRRIKRNARRCGQITRNQAYAGHTPPKAEGTQGPP